jgi:fructose-1,6-bisphosphatase/inositol monophosphatase family enzyme
MFDIHILYGWLTRAKAYLQTITDGTTILRQGASFGDLTNDTELKADRLLGQELANVCQETPGVTRVTVEGLGDFVCVEGKGWMRRDQLGDDEIAVLPQGLWVCIDPIDGSLNFKMRGRSLGGPFTTVITVLAKNNNATFNDIIAAGVIDLRIESGDTWVAYKDEHGAARTYFKGKLARTSDAEALDPGSQIIFAETYYPGNRDWVNRLFNGQKGNFSRLGSAGYEMACVAIGVAVAFLCNNQKQHELGAAYLLVKGAGGVAIDCGGGNLATHPYVFHKQTPVILAANQRIVADILAA